MKTAHRRRIIVAFLALIAAILVLGTVGEATRERSALDSLPRGSDSAKVAAAAERLPDAESSAAVVLFSADERMTPAQLAAVRTKAAALPGGAKAPVIPAKDGTAVTVPVTIDAVDATAVEEKVSDLRAQLASGLPQGVQAQVTGPAAIQADLAQVFKGANIKLLAATALIVAVLLVITYRSPVLWIVPLLVVAVADRLAAILASHVLSAFSVAWDESTTGILSVLVFGAGTDYALLLISRYRDELRRHENRHEAMAITVRRTVEPVVASSVTIFVGLITLLLSLFPTTRGLGLACAVGVLVAALFALVVLPGVLVVFGRWIFWPRKPAVGEASAAESASLWQRIGGLVARRPAAVAVAGTAALLLAATGLFATKTGLSDSDQFLRTPESITAAERLGESFPAGSSSPLTVITPVAEASDVTATLRRDPSVASVQPTGRGAGLAQFQVIVTETPGTEASETTVKRLRSSLASTDGTFVGGGDAERIDEADATSRDRWVILPLVLAVVLGALVLLLRSLVAPVILVASVVLTYAASLGLSWWLFTQVFGFERLDAGGPLTAFVFLVALGVDYNIFLVTRAREEAETHGSRQGMLRALTATGGVITSAGILLAAVFAVLGVLPLVVLAQLGIIIFVGVLLDTLLVRTILVPAIAWLLGDRFWWPRRPHAAAASQ